jgi:hypothetical protein
MTSHTRSTHWSLALLGSLLLALAISTPALASGGYGEVLRFKGKGAGGGGDFEFAGQETHAFAVDPEDGAVYVGDEKEEHSGNLRIQRYSASGAFEADATIKEPASLPAGVSGFVGYEGFALDPQEHRLYVLAVYKRFVEDNVDPNEEVAGALYALSTAPSAGKLVPATGTGKEGLLGTTESLDAGSETRGDALLDPTGIAVDPTTGEVLILGLADGGAGSLHVAVAHVSSSGSLLTPYVGTAEGTRNNEPDSPVVSSNGKLFFEENNELLELPASATSGAPATLFYFSEPEAFLEGPFAGELTSFGGGETGAGGGLSIVSEGGADQGRIVADAEVHEESEAGVLGEGRNGVLNLAYTEEGENVKVSEIGWTGGVPGEGEGQQGPHEPCEIGFANGGPLVAAAGGSSLYVLAPAWSEVIELGLGGAGCPAAKEAPSGLEVAIDGKPVTNPETTDTVTLSAKIVQGSVLSTKWVFGDGQETEVTTPAGEQTQTAQVAHKFAKGGELPVEAIVHTDDLATPEIVVKGLVTVVEAGRTAPKVSPGGNPVSQAKVEGESASFQAAASGDPTPTVQWEASTDSGATWKPVPGATSDTFTIQSTVASESGYEYRATFENGVGSPAKTTAATLTVESKQEHEKRQQEEAQRLRAQEEQRHQEEAALAAQRQREQEEAAAKRQQEEAKRHQEEVGRTGPSGGGEASPRATLAATSVSVGASGAAAVKVGCPAGVTQCAGTVTLRTVGAVSARAGRKAKKVPLTLGAATFTVAGGQAQTVTVHLSSAARKLLARLHVVQVQAIVSAHDPSGGASTVTTVLTLRAAKARR